MEVADSLSQESLYVSDGLVNVEKICEIVERLDRLR